jgi:LacI family transcriptional regulator
MPSAISSVSRNDAVARPLDPPTRHASSVRELPKVALLVETSRGFGREMLRGIARYAQLHGPWSFHITAGDFDHDVPKMKQWGGSGIIARIPNERVAKAILDADLPTIALGLTDEQMRPDSPLSAFSELSSDAREVARIAAEHLLERKFRHYAYVGLEDRAWSTRREVAFGERLAAVGFQTHIYRQPKRRQDQVWEREQAILADWIRRLPKPVGLFACNDDRGREVLEACRLAELRVPEDVAVLGVDDDEVFCQLANPPLSSVALNAETAGYRAAELLDGMMQGRVKRPRRIVVEALCVVTRRSTDIVAVEDQDVATALEFIHREQGRDISVDSVVQEVAVSRRNLEKRFRETIGRTILEEIQITRLERAKRLLLETAYPISKIAEIAGFGSTGYFIQFFQSRVGKTPRRFRNDLAS